MIDLEKDIKCAGKRKWTEREYHVQDSKDIHHKSVKVSFASTKFTALTFFVPHEKSHGVRGLIKHYHLQLEPKLDNGKCAIKRIPCACNVCTNMSDKHWAIVVELIDQPRYQSFKY